MPWIRKFPGTGFYFNDAYLTWMRMTVGAIFIVAGTLSLLDVVELN
jgi:hypothetical protein